MKSVFEKMRNVFQFFRQDAKSVSLLFRQAAKSVLLFWQDAKSVSLFSTKCEKWSPFFDKMWEAFHIFFWQCAKSVLFSKRFKKVFFSFLQSTKNNSICLTVWDKGAIFYLSAIFLMFFYFVCEYGVLS